ncbi:PAS domain-containing sensor histidine kinase [Pontibacter ruber]|uniref:histidine kinase n=1 Tax=Pontibacter ruber TaxID=1343895 RepID=A0ABW5CVJ1_9BACT|nr:PAS domain-containing protein [Pontibacter ruber]
MKTTTILSREVLGAYEQVPDPYLILSPGLVILTASDAYLKATFTRREEIVGRYIFDVFPDNPETPDVHAVENLLASLQQVLSSGQPHRMEVHHYDVPHPEAGNGFVKKYWLTTNTPVLDVRGEVSYIIHKVEDVTEQKAAKANLKAEHRRLRDAQAIGHVGSFEWNIITDKIYWSDEMYRIHGLEPQSETITLKRLLSFVHPDDLAKVKELFMDCRRKPQTIEIEHRVLKGNDQIGFVCRKVQSFADAHGNVTHLSGTVQDITNKEIAEQELKDSKALLQTVLENTPSSIIALKAVRNEFGEITDFEYQFTNRQALESVGRSSLEGKRFNEEFPGALTTGLFQAYKNVVETGLDWSDEVHIDFDGFDVWAFVLAKKLKDGVLVNYYDISWKKKAEETVRQMLNGSMAGIALLDSVRDKEGRIMEFVYREINTAAESIFMLPAERIAGKGLLELYPHAKDNIFEEYVQVVETGISSRAVFNASRNGFTGWYDVSAVKNGDGLILTLQDITAQKQAEEALKENHKLLLATLSSSLDMIQVFKAVRDENGKIIDFTWLLNNPKAENLYGNVVGKSLLKLNPGVVNAGIFDSFVQVTETGVPQQYEQHYVHEQFDGWFNQSVVKLEDGVATTTTDISDRKEKEQEILRLKDEVALRATDKYYALFDTIEEGLAICSVVRNDEGKVVDLRFLELNRALEQQIGLDRYTIIGKKLSEVLPKSDAKRWIPLYIKVANSGKPVTFEEHTDLLNRWYAVSVYPKGEELSIFYRDITERKNAEEALRASEEKYRTLFNSMDEGYCIIQLLYDEAGRATDFRYLQVNKAFEHNTDLHNVEGKTIRELAPDIEPKWMEIYDQVAQTGIPLRFEEASDALQHVFSLYAFRIGEPSEHKIAVIFSDITERRKTEKALRESEERFRNLVESYAQAIWETSATGEVIVDSPSWRAYTGQTIEEWLGYGWVNAIHPDDQAYAGRQWRKAVAAKSLVDAWFRMQHAASGGYRWTNVRATPILDDAGNITKWVGMNIDVHEQKKAEEVLANYNARLEQEVSERTNALKESNERFEAAINVSPVVLGILKGIRDEQQKLTDFKVEWISKSGEAMYGRDITGLRLSEYFPHLWNVGVFQKFVKTVETGSSTDYENFYKGDGLEMWVHWRAIQLEDGLFISVEDVTKRKKAELELKESKLFVDQVMEATPDFIMVFNLETNTVEYVNRRAYLDNEARYNETLQIDYEHLLDRAHPDDRKALDSFIQRFRTAADNAIHSLDYRVLNGDNVVWYRATGKVFKRNHKGVATKYISVVQDITERRKAEQELVTQYQVLKQAEEIAHIGSWEYDPGTGQMTWSEGMYRLFGLPPGSPVSPQSYLEFVIEEDRPVAEKIIQHLVKARKPLEETLRIRVNEQVSTIKTKVIVVRNKQGKSVKLLGMDLDISEIKRLEEENLTLRLNQQKALLLAILEAQEEEKREIAEALHNGVGQLLYATKLNLERLAETVQHQSHGGDEAIQTTQELLTEAIDETRRVSHELTPALLRDFGLSKALGNFCRMYNRSSLQLKCQVEGLPNHLEPYLELSLYRICQELINNIIRHAQATKASVKLSRKGAYFLLQVRDNGIGFSREQGKIKGMGLKSVEDRLKFLNGTLSISTPKTGKGTWVSIRIPVGD